jgi:hypothetical protein
VYIGDAIFIDGARPDVQAANPGVPFNTRAGWGYLMLTNFLPSGGNGTFTLYAYALDADGHTSLLGSKVIGLDNAHATKPFGSIDTPTQGEVVCGSAYLNFGWALTQSPKDVAADSSTISAFVDSVFVGHPGQRAARPDITAAFPASDTSHAVGGLAVDTTAFANGVHTIFWVVSDTGGQTDGIGSRFFTISNPCRSGLTLDPSAAAASNVIASTATLQMPRAAALRMSSPQTLTAEIDAAPADLSSIQGRRGFDLDAPLARYTPVGGRITVQSEEIDRIELHLSAGGRHQYTGYLRTVAGVTPLPIGSSLDAPTGAFAWMPGVGFVGTYDLVFVRWSGGRAVARQEVRIVLNPKGSNRVGPQVVIDAPAASASGGSVRVGRAFMLAGSPSRWRTSSASPCDSHHSPTDLRFPHANLSRPVTVGTLLARVRDLALRLELPVNLPVAIAVGRARQFERWRELIQGVGGRRSGHLDRPGEIPLRLPREHDTVERRSARAVHFGTRQDDVTDRGIGAARRARERAARRHGRLSVERVRIEHREHPAVVGVRESGDQQAVARDPVQPLDPTRIDERSAAAEAAVEHGDQ